MIKSRGQPRERIDRPHWRHRSRAACIHSYTQTVTVFVRLRRSRLETELLTVPPVPHFHLCMSLINTTRLQDPLLLCHQRLNVLLLFPVLSNITNERKTPYNTVQAVFFGKILQVRQ